MTPKVGNYVTRSALTLGNSLTAHMRWGGLRGGQLQLRKSAVQLDRPWALPRTGQILRGGFTHYHSVLPLRDLLARLTQVGLTEGTAAREVVVCPFLRSAGRGLYRSRSVSRVRRAGTVRGLPASKA